MKRNTKKILLYAAVALMIIILAAALIMFLQKDAYGENYFTRNKAVATVNGVKITQNEYAYSLSNLYNMYVQYGYGAISEETMHVLQNNVINGLIDNEVSIQMAKELGITLTDEEKAAVKQSAQDQLSSLKEQILTSAKSSGAQNPETYATTMLADYFSNMGISQRQFLSRNEHAAMAEQYATKIQEYYANQCDVKDEDLKDIYAKYAKEYYQDTYLEGAYAYYALADDTGVPYLYIPESFLFVQVIQISDAEEAEKVFDEIKAGGDFETYRTSEDNENEECRALNADQGQPIGENDSIFDEVVFVTAKSMTVGDVEMAQAETKDSDGNATSTYYIIKRVEGTTGIIPYEEVKSDTLDGILKNYTTQSYYTEQMEAWREKAVIVIDDEAVHAFNPAA